MSTSLDKQQIFGELTYVLQPLIHLSSLGIFGIKSWTPWLLSVICDILRWIFYKKWRPLISREKFQHLYKHGCGLFSYIHNSIIKKRSSWFFKFQLSLFKLANHRRENLGLNSYWCAAILHSHLMFSSFYIPAENSATLPI